MDKGGVGKWPFPREDTMREVSFEDPKAPTGTQVDATTDQRIFEAIARMNRLSSAVASQAQEAIALVTQKAEESQKWVEDHKAELSQNFALSNIASC